MYFVQYNENVILFLKKITISDRIKIEKAIVELRFYPKTKGKFIGKSKNGVSFFEKRLFSGKGYRIYYSVFEGQLVIDTIVYSGRALIHKIGDKKTQKEDIKKLKK